jgi:hypothetical protein
MSARSGALYRWDADERLGEETRMAADDGSSGGADRRSGVERLRDRLRARFSPKSPPPWRVEGADGKDRQGKRVSGSRFWWLLVLMLVVNWIITSLLLLPRLGRRCRIRSSSAR